MKTFLLSCLCLLSSLLGWAKQANDAVYFRYYFDQLNLPRTTILQMEQDKRGFLWLATGQGVYRFDGHEAVPLSEIVPGHDEILKQYTSWIRIDDNAGVLWMSTGYVFEFETGVLRRNQISTEFMQNPPLIDAQGNLWLSFWDRYVKYKPSRKESTVLQVPVGVGLTQSEHYVWGITRTGMLQRMPIGKGNISTISYDLTHWDIQDVTAMCAVSDKQLLIGTRYAGLWIYDVQQKMARRLFQENYIRSILAYSSSVYWIATENGIYIYDVLSGSIDHWTKDSANPFSIQDHAIYSFYKDREGGIWCSGYFRGLFYAPNGKCRFHTFKSGKQYPGLKGTVFREFCQDSQGCLWIGTEDGGLNVYNMADGGFINFSKGSGLGTNNIHGLYLDGNELWCGSFDNGIEVFDVEKQKVVRSYKMDDTIGLQSNFVFTILRMSDGQLWIGTDRGVQRFDKTKGVFYTIYPNITLCSMLFQDSRESIWCIGKGVFCITKDGSMKRYDFGTRSVQSIMETSRGDIWIATSEGIAHLDRQKDVFVLHTLFDLSAATNYTYRIVEDGLGYFWISTSYGLVRFNPDTRTSYVYTTSEGLPENRFNMSSSFRDDQGNIYFGTIDGFVSFDPSLLLPSKIVPRPGLTQLTCTGVNSVRTFYSFSDPIFYIDYKENNVTFKLSSFTYTAPDALRYRYRLDPVDKNWHLQQGYVPFTYPGLPPGEYKLRIQTTDYNGEWLPEEIHYTLRVIPPFYASWWARLIYILLFGGGIAVLLKMWHNRIRKRQQMHIQEERNATEKEIYHTKINFFTTIVHEIRTPLTLIKVPLEKELEKNPSENLLLMEKNVDRLLDLCTQILDFRKIESDHLQLNFVKTNLSDLLKGILYRYSAQIMECGLICQDNLDELVLEAPVDRDIITKIVSNLLSNAVKYARRQIKIELTADQETFYLSVFNDGHPIAKNDRNKIFNMFYRTSEAQEKIGSGIGLSFCRSLAEMHHGRLDLVDNEEYTHFRLSLPLKQEIVLSIEAVSDDVSSDQMVDFTVSEDKGLTILVVEDEPELRDFLKKTLSEMYHVVVAGNGLQAMDVIRKIPVSLVITDVMMPKMDGCELCRALKSHVEFSGIPVVMLTAKNTVEARLDGYMAGAEEYIEKPFSMKYLLARVMALIEKKRKEAVIHYESLPGIKLEHLANNSNRVLVEKFRKLVEENLTNDKLDIPFLCERLSMSQSTFFRKLKPILNVSPNDYIRIARLERAAAILLENDSILIRDVAYDLGFSTPSYFTRCFIQYYGMSPKDYIALKKEKKA